MNGPLPDVGSSKLLPAESHRKRGGSSARKGANPLKDTTYDWNVINQTLQFAASVDMTNFDKTHWSSRAEAAKAEEQHRAGFWCRDAVDC